MNSETLSSLPVLILITVVCLYWIFLPFLLLNRLKKIHDDIHNAALWLKKISGQIDAKQTHESVND